MTTIRFPAKIERLDTGLSHVAGQAFSLGFGPGRLDEINLVVEEALVNICKYAYPRADGQVEIRCLPTGEGEFLVELVDEGISFDILALPVPDLTADTDRRKVGGLGVLLIRTLADRVGYLREEGRNVLRLWFRLPQPLG